MNEHLSWWSETSTTIAAVISSSAMGRILFVGYHLRGTERKVVLGYLALEIVAALMMGVLALGSVGVLEQVFEISLHGWPSFSLAAILGWLGPRGLQGLISSIIIKRPK